MLENSNLCFEDLVAYSKAISSIEVYDNISFADTGEDCPVIANISDFMLALKEVSFSVVYSREGKGGVQLSVRSEKPSLDAGKIVSKALAGLGSGGGHAEMAGGFVTFDGNEKAAVILLDDDQGAVCSVIGPMWRLNAMAGTRKPLDNGNI